MLHRPHQTAFLLLLCTVLSVSAQMFPDAHDISKMHVDTLRDGTTVEYVRGDSSVLAKNDSAQKPRKKLWHPVATGMGMFGIGLLLAGTSVAMSFGHTSDNGPAIAIGIPGLILVAAGELYAIVGGTYNSSISDAEDRIARNGNNAGPANAPLHDHTAANDGDYKYSGTSPPVENGIQQDPLKASHAPRLWHPVLTGMGVALVGATLSLYESSNLDGKASVNQMIGGAGTLMAYGGLGYAIWGGAHNAKLSSEEKYKAAAAQHYGLTPALSFTPTGKPQPGMMAWVRF